MPWRWGSQKPSSGCQQSGKCLEFRSMFLPKKSRYSPRIILPRISPITHQLPVHILWDLRTACQIAGELGVQLMTYPNSELLKFAIVSHSFLWRRKHSHHFVLCFIYKYSWQHVGRNERRNTASKCVSSSKFDRTPSTAANPHPPKETQPQTACLIVFIKHTICYESNLWI